MILVFHFILKFEAKIEHQQMFNAVSYCWLPVWKAGNWSDFEYWLNRTLIKKSDYLVYFNSLLL